jgi:hypothetical protein
MTNDEPITKGMDFLVDKTSDHKRTVVKYREQKNFYVANEFAGATFPAELGYCKDWVDSDEKMMMAIDGRRANEVKEVLESLNAEKSIRGGMQPALDYLDKLAGQRK